MEYIKGKPYFCQVSKKIKQYPYLNENINCDILIVGGGINGAIANFYLSKKYDVVLVDKSRLGMSGTSCATVLLEYQLDEYAEDLKKLMSEQDIVNVYKMGLKSIDMIEQFIKQNGNKCHFRKIPSFMYTTNVLGVKALEKEHKFRVKHGFSSEFYNQITNPFPFKIKAGIYNIDGGAEFNPYLFAQQLFKNCKNQDRIFENTEIISIIKNKNYFQAFTNFGNVINCKKIILATGFNFSLLNEKDKKLCSRTISYTIVTKPIKNLKWKTIALFQDDQSPYHYFRILPDNRIIFGGEDTKFNAKPINQKLARKKYDKLVKDLKNLLPKYKQQIDIEYEFCGVFGSTDNNLGLIGKTQIQNLYYFLSAGANGIINAMFGAKLIEDILENRENVLEKLFSPCRT